MYLLVYSNKEEFITQSLMENSSLLKDELLALSVEEILNEVIIEDEINQGVASLKWTLPNGRVIQNTPDVLLINRVEQLNPNLFKHFHPDDQDYALHEFQAYLSFALEAFSKKTAAPTFLGLCGKVAPLPYQWQLVGDMKVSIKTPQYFLGPKNLSMMSPQSDKHIIGDTYNFYSWRPNADAKKWDNIHADDLLFIFERPAGTPLPVFTCGKKVIASSGQVPEEIHRLAPQIASTLKTECAEMLFFVNEEEITFAMASPLMGKASKAMEGLLPTLAQALEELHAS